MPPQIQALLEDRQKLMIAGGAVLALILLVVGFLIFGSGSKETDSSAEPLLPEQLELATVTSAGKAIEIQALMAKQNIQVDRASGDGGKMILKLTSKATTKDRDIALVTLVQSGLMDGTVGLEAFDQSDLTASREEKRIKLIRAQQGEISRLIRKIQPIEDAKVQLSIPDPSIFQSEQKPLSASVQVTLPVGERLDQEKVKAIMNLVVGAVQGLTPDHVAMSDTNGNTYNSVLGPSSDLQQKLLEQDQYMREKIGKQLDRLVGPGNYEVTVSTQLRENTEETMVERFDPGQSAVSTKQQFSERMNSQNTEAEPGGPVSAFLPKDMSGSSNTESSQKGYTRDGVEVAYANGKIQTIETKYPGMVEDITIAVTINENHYPEMEDDDLKSLIARAASPQVDTENVSIVRSQFRKPTAFGQLDRPVQKDTATNASIAGLIRVIQNNWLFLLSGVFAIVFFLAIMGLLMSKGSDGQQLLALEQAQLQINDLRHMSEQQQQQMMSAQQQTQNLTQQMMAEQQRAMQVTQQLLSHQQHQSTQAAAHIKKVMEELKSVSGAVEQVDPTSLNVKEWLE